MGTALGSHRTKTLTLTELETGSSEPSLLLRVAVSLPHLRSPITARILLSQLRDIPPHPRWLITPTPNQIPHAHACCLISPACPQQESGLVSLARIPLPSLSPFGNLPSTDPTPTLFLGCEPPAVFTVLGMEPNSTLGSLFPHCNGF